LKYANEDNQERVEKIVSEITRAFTNSTQEFLKCIVKLSFAEIERDIMPKVFTYKWSSDEEQFIPIVLATMDDYFGSFQKWFITPAYLKTAVRLSFDYLLDIYIERFLWCIQKSYNTLGDYMPKNLNINKPKKDKKEKRQKQFTSISVLSNSDLLIKCMSRDLNLLKIFAGEKYANYINKNYNERMDTLFGLIFNLLKVPKYDFETLLHPIAEHFKDLGKYVLIAILSIREDCDSTFKKDMTGIYIGFISKKG